MGRRVFLGVYYAGVVALMIASTTQITRQVFFKPVTKSPYATCREGLEALTAAVGRARGAARGSDGEEAALAQFRAELTSPWSHRDGIAQSCQASEADARALDAIERLRYAEENAVRREAGDLAPLRRRVQAIVDHDLAPDAGKSSP